MTEYKEGVILAHNGPLARNLKIWQSLVQLCIGRRFNERYDLFCAGFAKEEDVKQFLADGWYLGAVKAKAVQYNGKRVPLNNLTGTRAAILVNFEEKSCRIVVRKPGPAATKHIEENGSKMESVPLIVKTAEDFKARVWAD